MGRNPTSGRHPRGDSNRAEWPTNANPGPRGGEFETVEVSDLATTNQYLSMKFQMRDYSGYVRYDDRRLAGIST
jgi:hypothetical protein